MTLTPLSPLVGGTCALLVGAGLMALAACDSSAFKPGPSWAERKAAAERRELWSVEVVGGRAQPLPICTDVAMRIGFVRPSPSIGTKPCIRNAKPVERTDNYAFRCELDGQEWAVVSYWSGDRNQDFTDTISVSSLDAPGTAYSQTRHYRRLGACPSGWSIGESRDQQGRHTTSLEAIPAGASAPP